MRLCNERMQHKLLCTPGNAPILRLRPQEHLFVQTHNSGNIDRELGD